MAGPNPNPPTVSIVTVVLNEALQIQQLLSCVTKHVGPDVELIVIDGGSTDGTLDVLKRYENKIQTLVSEPDKGLYDAMNKALPLCSGSFVIHINAGDLLYSIPLQQLKQLPDTVVCASYNVELSDGRLYKPHSGWRLRYRNTLHHQGTFYRRNALGSYDTGFRLYADHDLNLRLLNEGRQILCFDETIAFHDLGGISRHGDQKEMLAIVKLHGGNFWRAITVLHGYFYRVRRKIRKVMTFMPFARST